MKKAKRFLATLCSLVLAVALLASNMSLVAFAVTGGGNDTADYKLNANVDSSVVYGSEFSVELVDGYELTVTAPSGEVVDVNEEGKVIANQIGKYIVTYTKGELSYKFSVDSKMDESYELYVGQVVNGLFYSVADIPTYAEVNKEYKIPSAYLGVTNENGVTTLVKKVEPSFSGVTPVKTADSFKFEQQGTAFIRYQATVGVGAKVLSKDYTIKVQNGLSDTKMPTLSVTNFPKSGQVNSKITLSTASVSDDYDKSVKVEISVLDPNGKAVTSAVVDSETGYATSYGEDALFFDNAAGRTYYANGDKSYGGLYFYPQEKGEYKVTYKAFDDQGNTPDAKEYTINVSDGRAPSIKYDASSIPTNWGYESVSNIDGEIANNKIHFGMPEFYDNETKKEDIKVTLTITDPNGKTVARFDNINSAEGRKYTSSNSVFATAPVYEFTDEGFDFDIKTYVETINAAVAESGVSYIVTGNYTVVYSAKDTTGNTASTATYSINVVKNYTDDAEPVVTIDNAPVRVLLKDGAKFTVPNATYYSENDSNLTVSYKLVSGESEIEVAGGDVLVYADGKLGELEVTGNTVSLVATATSDAGNSTTKTVEIEAVNAQAKDVAYEVVLVQNENADLRNGIGEINYGTVKIGEIAAEEVKNVGVELGIKNAEGAYLSQFSAEIYWADNTKIVRDITFVPSSEGMYYLEVKVFDIYGNNSVRIYPIEIAEKEDTGSIGSGASAGTLATTAKVYSTVELANKSFTLNNVGTYMTAEEQANVYVATSHVISGGRFSLMGEELVMMTAGTYKVTDRPIIVSKNDYTADFEGTQEGYAAWLNSYAIEKKSIVATQDTDIVFEVVGSAVPAYVEKINEKVVLPAMIAYNSIENAAKKDVTVKVTHSSGTQLKVTEEADGTYSFEPNKEGTYNVEYTAVVGGTTNTTSCTIKVGDIFLPEFTVEAHATTAKVGDSFKFNVINCTESSVTYLKTLSKDSSTLNTVKTKTGTGDNIKFESAGTYEVKYTVTDSNGNSAEKVYTITVTEASNTGIQAITVISIVLVCVAVVLVAGIVVYLIVSRKKTSNK